MSETNFSIYFYNVQISSDWDLPLFIFHKVDQALDGIDWSQRNVPISPL